MLPLFSCNVLVPSMVHLYAPNSMMSLWIVHMRHTQSTQTLQRSFTICDFIGQSRLETILELNWGLG